MSSVAPLQPLPEDPVLRTKVLIYAAALMHARAVRQYELIVERIVALPDSGISGRLADAIVIAHGVVIRTQKVLAEGLAELRHARTLVEHVRNETRRLGELEADEAWGEP